MVLSSRKFYHRLSFVLSFSQDSQSRHAPKAWNATRKPLMPCHTGHRTRPRGHPPARCIPTAPPSPAAIRSPCRAGIRGMSQGGEHTSSCPRASRRAPRQCAPSFPSTRRCRRNTRWHLLSRGAIVALSSCSEFPDASLQSINPDAVPDRRDATFRQPADVLTSNVRQMGGAQSCLVQRARAIPPAARLLRARARGRARTARSR